MFAYLIIGSELAILYTVFWYVFLREPKPYKVSGNPWGHYDNGASQLINRLESCVNQGTPEAEGYALSELTYEPACNDHSVLELNRTAPDFDGCMGGRIGHNCSDLPQLSRNPAVNYQWDFEKATTPEKEKIRKLLLGFRDTIQFHFKVT